MNGQANATSEAPSLVAFSQFLECTPPSTFTKIADLALVNRLDRWELSRPALQLHCSSDHCNGTRTFRTTTSGTIIESYDPSDIYLDYVCSNCRLVTKIFALRVKRDDGSVGTAVKYGEYPAFGPTTPARLLRLIQTDRETFLNGRRCENLGLGVGAFAYYRRVVENQRSRILQKLIAVSTRLHASSELIAELEAAKSARQFTESVEQIKAALPAALLIDGHNPLTLLHKALSDGLHARDDAHCLSLAHAIRLVLAHLAEKSAQVLNDEKELKDAVSKLLAAPKSEPQTG